MQVIGCHDDHAPWCFPEHATPPWNGNLPELPPPCSGCSTVRGEHWAFFNHSSQGIIEDSSIVSRAYLSSANTTHVTVTLRMTARGPGRMDFGAVGCDDARGLFYCGFFHDPTRAKQPLSYYAPMVPGAGTFSYTWEGDVTTPGSTVGVSVSVFDRGDSHGLFGVLHWMNGSIGSSSP
jgi:hypothetical protein